MWRIVSLAAFVLILAIAIRWAVDGTQVFTKTKQQVLVKDELLGTESVTWEEGLWMGADVAGPAVLVLLGVGGYGIYRSRKGGIRA